MFLSTEFSNLPISDQVSTDTAGSNVDYFENLNKVQLAFKASESDAIIAYFKSIGMDDNAAKSVGFIFLKQCKIDKVDAIQLLDSLRKLKGTQLTSVLGEILNLNRVRTSALGNAAPPFSLMFPGLPPPMLGRNLPVSG